MMTHLSRRAIPIGPVKITLDDVRTIFNRLTPLMAEQAEREIASLRKIEGHSDEEFENFKRSCREQAFRIGITITGNDGDSLSGDDGSVLSSPNRPQNIAFIYMTNLTSYQGFTNVRPLNYFELNLDFSKPPLLDANTPVSSPTRNLSSLAVQSDKESWMAGITEAVMSPLRLKKAVGRWMHRGFSYDAGLALFGLPFAFYSCWKARAFVKEYVGGIHDLVSAAAYVYIFTLVLWGYRLLFGYSKWAFPAVELTDNKDAAAQHRALLGVIVVGLAIDVIWSFFGR